MYGPCKYSTLLFDKHFLRKEAPALLKDYLQERRKVREFYQFPELKWVDAFLSADLFLAKEMNPLSYRSYKSGKRYRIIVRSNIPNKKNVFAFQTLFKSLDFNQARKNNLRIILRLIIE